MVVRVGVVPVWKRVVRFLETRFHLLIRNFTVSPHEGAKIWSVFRTLDTCCLLTQECVRHVGLAIARRCI